VIRDPATLTLLMDEAGVLTDGEARELREKLVAASNKHQADIVIVTVNSLDGASPRDFADDYFDYNGYGRGQTHDGLLLLISLEERDWWISTTGSAIYAFTDAGIQFIGERMISTGLSSGDYTSALTTFVGLSDRFFQKAATGAPFDIGNLPKTAGDLLMWIVLGLVGGLVIALITTGRMKKQLTSVQFKKQACDYVLPGSLLVSSANDELLGRNVTKIAKPVESSSSSRGGGSSTHTSSSGRSHGGGGGKF